VPSRCPHAASVAYNLSPFHGVSDVPLAVFKTAALNHSATLPRSQRQRLTHWPSQTKVDIAAESRRRPPFAGPLFGPDLSQTSRVHHGESGRRSGVDRLSGAGPALALPDQIEARRTRPQKRKPRGSAGLVPGSAYVRTARGLGESESRPARLACSR